MTDSVCSRLSFFVRRFSLVMDYQSLFSKETIVVISVRLKYDCAFERLLEFRKQQKLIQSYHCYSCR